jgi:hypothetical protein
MTTLPLVDWTAGSAHADWSFTPLRQNGDVAEYIHRHATDPHLDRVVTVSTRVQSNKAQRTVVKLTAPIDRSLSNGFSPEYEDAIIELNLRFPDGTLATERADLRKLAQSLLGDASIVSFIDNSEGVF